MTCALEALPKVRSFCGSEGAVEQDSGGHGMTEIDAKTRSKWHVNGMLETLLQGSAAPFEAAETARSGNATVCHKNWNSRA